MTQINQNNTQKSIPFHPILSHMKGGLGSDPTDLWTMLDPAICRISLNSYSRHLCACVCACAHLDESLEFGVDIP